MDFFKKMYCSCLLFFSCLMVFSNVDAASIHKRGLIPTNINLDLKLGKGSAAKNAEAPPPTDGSHKTVINAPFGLASLTITTNNNKKPSPSSPIKEPGKPCNSDSEYIASSNDKPPHFGGSSNSGTLGGKGSAFFGPPHMSPHSEFGPPPPPHDFHHPHPDSHYPPPPSSHHFHHYPPPPPPHHPHHPHHHHPDCHHGEFFPSFTSGTEIPFVPGSKPDAKFTTVPPPKEKLPEVTNTSVSSTTQNVDLLIDEIFSGSNSASSTTVRNNIDANDREQTGEGTLDIRMPPSAPSKPKRS